jgi:hypothetical protein
VVIVRLPVPVKVSVDAPEEKEVIAEFKVRLPKILLVTFPKVPVKPLVNVRLLKVIPAVLFIVSLPALIVNEIGALVASEFPGLTVLVVVLLPVILTWAVPVIVNPVFVDVGPLNTVPDTPVTVISPEPNAIVRAFVVFEENSPVDSVKLFRFSVPAVSVKVDEVNSVIASASVTVIPEPLIVVLPSVFVTLVTVDEAKNVGRTEVYVPPEARVRFPAMFNPDAVTEQVLPVKFTFLK